jgi:purine-binding chemotaxis protein CheW
LRGPAIESTAIAVTEEGGAMKMTSAQGSEDPVLQWVTFRLDNETYGINVMQVQEVLRYTEIAPVPGAPSYVLGIINLRGNVVTVIDTRQRFGLETALVSDNTRIVIIEADRQVIGIMVDSVAEVVYLRQSEIETAPNVGNDESAKFIQGVCNKNGELLILVELDKMMSEEEWAELESI